MCEAYKTLMQLKKINASELAKVVSKSKTYVSNVLSLDKLPAEIKQLVREGRIGLAKGALIARMDPEEQQELNVESLSREKLERKTSRTKLEGKPVRRVTLDMPAAKMSVVGRAKMSVDELIDMLQSLVRECKRARSQGVDISTLSCILRDRAKLDAEGGA